MQRASQQRATAQQRAAAQRTNLLARPLGSRPQQPAAMPKQVAGQMAAFNSAQLQQLQKEKMLREQQNQRYLGNPAAQDQLNQSPNNLQNLAAQQAAFTKQQADAQKQSMAMANAPKMPAMRKGGAVKKKPGYAKGGMVMANCGASMKPQQKAKK